MLLCVLMRDVNRPNQDDPSVIGEATLTVDLIFQENLDGPDATLPPHFYTVVYPCSQTYLYFLCSAGRESRLAPIFTVGEVPKHRPRMPARTPLLGEPSTP